MKNRQRVDQLLEQLGQVANRYSNADDPQTRDQALGEMLDLCALVEVLEIEEDERTGH